MGDPKRYQEFLSTLNKLGKNDDERASAIGVSRRTVIFYRAGQLPYHIRRLMRHPELLRALARDAEQTRNTDQAA